MEYYKLFIIFAKIFCMKKFLVTILLLEICVFSMAQVRYDVEPAVEVIQQDYIKAWEKVGEVKGYRIQIMAFTGINSRSTAESERSLFGSRYPEIPAYISYNEPYFKIRVGNFLTRLEAYKALLEIQESYPGAYVIPDKITYTE